MSGACREQRPTATPRRWRPALDEDLERPADERLPEACGDVVDGLAQAGGALERELRAAPGPPCPPPTCPPARRTGRRRRRRGRLRARKSSSSSNSSSVSPGNPAMNVERTAAPGSARADALEQAQVRGAVAGSAACAAGRRRRRAAAGHRRRAPRAAPGPPEAPHRCRRAAGRAGAARRGRARAPPARPADARARPSPGCVQREVSWPTSTSSRAPAASAARAAARISAAATVS